MTTSRHLMVRFLRQKGFVSHFKYIKQYNLGLYFARRYCTSHGIFSRNVTEALDRIMTEERVKLAPYNVECVFGHNSKRAITNALLYTVDRDFNYTNPVLIPEDQHHLYHSFATYFSDIYEEGFEHMRRFIVDGEQPPANLLPPIAALQTFFAEKEYHETCLKTLLTENDFKGAEESTILAIHLMSKLIYPSYAPYMISNEYLYKPKRCPCYDSHTCRRDVIYGNTGMGSDALWICKPDILLYPNVSGPTAVCSIMVPSETTEHLDNEEAKEKSQEDTEGHGSYLQEERHVYHIFAQAITFSLYQRKFQRKNYLSPVVSVIPTISIGKDGFDIYMYDAENDSLLKNYSKPIPLWNHNKSELRTTSVMYLWMMINHLAFRPSLPQYALEHIKGTSGFYDFVDDRRINVNNRTISLEKSYPPSKYKFGKHFNGSFVQLLDFSRRRENN